MFCCCWDFCKWDHMLLKTSALTCSWFELCIAQHVWRVKVINCFPWAPSLIVHCSCSLITWVKVLPASARPRLTWLGTRAKVCQQVKVFKKPLQTHFLTVFISLSQKRPGVEMIQVRLRYLIYYHGIYTALRLKVWKEWLLCIVFLSPYNNRLLLWYSLGVPLDKSTEFPPH